MAGLTIKGTANHQKDNTSSPQGGAIATDKNVMIGDVPQLIQIQLASQNPLDITQIYMIEGVGPTRAIESEMVQLSGAASATTTKSFTRLCRIEKQSGSPLLGDVTAFTSTSILGVMNAATLSSVEVTKLINLLPDAQGRATVDTAFYEKFFIFNSTGDTVNTLTIREFQSDFKDRVLFATDLSFDDNLTSLNRLTKPGELAPGDLASDTPIVVNSFPAGASIGIWLRVFVPAGEASILNSWKVELTADGVVQIFTLIHPEGSGNAFVDTLNKRNGHPIGGGNPLRFVELKGAKFVEQVFYEPDPRTFRDQFYYNTRLNRLFKKLNTKPVPVWKVVR